MKLYSQHVYWDVCTFDIQVAQAAVMLDRRSQLKGYDIPRLYATIYKIVKL